MQTENDVDSLDIPLIPPSPMSPKRRLVSTTRAISSRRCIAGSPTSSDPETRDICYATQNRQTAVRELLEARRRYPSGRRQNSSNSNRLREIGHEVGTPCYLIADGSEVEPEWFNGAQTVGITAGASAPEVLVEDVIDALRRLESGRCQPAALAGTRPSNSACRRN